MTARSTSRSRASCCCPCGLAPVVTVASSNRWGDATPCYASHHMMLVLLQLCVFKNHVCRQAMVYRVLPICRTYTHTHTNFFFSHVAIRNSLRSNKEENIWTYGQRQPSYCRVEGFNTFHLVQRKNYGLYCSWVCCSSQHHTNAKTRLSNRAGLSFFCGTYCA